VGNIALYLKEATGAKEVYGVEIAEKQVEAARHQGVQAVCLDVGTERLPFEDGFFDAIFCGEVIEHLVDTDHLLDEIYRTLSPKGLCVLTTPNLAGWYNRLALLFGYQPFPTSVSFEYGAGYPGLMGRRPGGGHLRVFTYAALVQLLKFHSFTVLDAAGAGILESAPPAHLSRARLAVRVVAPIDRALCFFPSLSGHVIVAVAKRQ
jgi:SAM-dependent methyltransferase